MLGWASRINPQQQSSTLPYDLLVLGYKVFPLDIYSVGLKRYTENFEQLHEFVNGDIQLHFSDRNRVLGSGNLLVHTLNVWASPVKKYPDGGRSLDGVNRTR